MLMCGSCPLATQKGAIVVSQAERCQGLQGDEATSSRTCGETWHCMPQGEASALLLLGGVQGLGFLHFAAQVP